MNSPANCSNRPFQDTEFNPPSLDRKGHPIDYEPPCLVSRIGLAAPPLKKMMKTYDAPTIITYQSSKHKAAQGITQKTVTGKRHHRTRPSSTQVNNPSSSQTDIQLLILFLHSYQPLRPNLLQVRNCCPRHLIQHQPNLHWLILKRNQFWLKQSMLRRQQKTRVLSFHPLMLARYFSQNFLFSFHPSLTIYHTRHSLRKHSCKGRSLAVYRLTVTLLMLTPRLSNLQSSKQLMVRKSYAQFIYMQQI